MNISRQNYEVFLVDYLDGKLDALGVSELLLFLEQHPDLKAEFALLTRLPAADPGAVQLPAREKLSLKKPEYSDIKDEYAQLLIARLEGDLSLAHHTTLDKALLLYPELQRDENVFAQTRLQAPAIVFGNKRSLHKAVPLLARRSTWMSVAAVLLAAALLWLLIPQRQPDTQLALQQGKPASTEKTQTTQSPATGEAAVQKSEHITPSIPSSTTDKLAPAAASNPAHKENPAAQAHTIVHSFASSTQHNSADQPGTKPDQAMQQQAPVLAANAAYIAPLQLRTPASLPQASFNTVAAPQPYPAQTVAGSRDIDLNHIDALIASNVQKQKEKVLEEDNKTAQVQVKSSDAGWLALNLFNRLTGAGIKVTRQYNKEGKVKSVVIAANNFEYTRRNN